VTEDNTIELELPDELMLQLMTMAHQRNQTFNDFVSDAIKRYALNTYVDAAENLAGQV
jgi:hypothetical protein